MPLDCKVSYRANVLLLEFNEEMSIVGPASAINPTNYAIDDGNVLMVLPSETLVDTIDEKNIRLKLPYYVVNYLKPNNYFNIGYIDRKVIRYVTSVSGEVYTICNVALLGAEAPEVNFTNGYGYLNGTNSINYKYTGENGFSTVYDGDFYATVNGVIKKPLKVEKISDDELVFMFETGTFLASDIVYLGVYSNPKTRDIYGLPIEGDLTLKIRTTPKPSLKTVSLSYINNAIDNKVFLMLMFDERIKYFCPDDFSAVYEGMLYSLVYTGNNYMDRKAFEVWIDLGKPVSLPMKRITLFTNVPAEDIRTINYEDVPINPVDQNITQVFAATNLTWRVYDNSLKSNIIDIYFDSEINCRTLITNSLFDSTPIPWDGSPLTIPIYAIEFIKGSSSDIMQLKNNPSFGKINIISKSGTSFISGNVSNNESATISSNGNKISITFSPTESADVRPMTIDTFNYEGTKLVMSDTNYFLCYSYKPLGILLTKDTIFVPPLNNASENPFKGGYQNPNYILSVDTIHPYRTYGDPNVLTTIGGFVRVEGAINPGEKVTLTNLKILGTLYLNVNYGDTLLSSIHTSNVIYS